MIEAKLKTWVLCCKPRPDHSSWNGEIHYWTGKGYGGHWVDDLSQATHYTNKGRAKATITSCRKLYREYPGFDFTDEDRMFVGEIDTTVQINEAVDEG